MPQPTIFISYSHKDEKEKDQLLVHLSVLQNAGLIELWSDESIGPGEIREAEITQAMAQAKVAILLVTANFLTSDFVLKKEIPTLLERREHEGITVIPIIGKACAWKSVSWLTRMSVRPKKRLPVWRNNGVYADEELAKIAEEVAEIIERNISTASEEKQTKDEFTVSRLLWEHRYSGEIKHIFASSEVVYLVVDDEIHFLSTSTGESLTSPQSSIGDFSLKEYSVAGGTVSASGDFFVTLLPRTFNRKAQLLALNVGEKSLKNSEPLSIEWHYEAPSTQLSAPVITDQSVYLIQKGPEVAALDIDNGNIQNIKRFDIEGDVHRDCVSLAFAANSLYIALCDGTILDLFSQPDEPLYKSPEGYRLSELATDGVHLFFGISSRHHRAVSIYALDVTSREILWQTDPLEKYWRMIGPPMVVDDLVYIIGGSRYIYTFDTATGNELGHQQMPETIDLGAIQSRNLMVLANRHGTIRALRPNGIPFIVTCHYDPQTPPTLNEWQPLIFTVINTSFETMRKTVLRLFGDFKGRPTEHLTQHLFSIQPGKSRCCSIGFNPTVAGMVVYLAVIVSYEQGGNVFEKKVDISLSVHKLATGNFKAKMTTLSRDGKYRYNHPALHACLMATLNNATLNRLCFEQFHPVYKRWYRGMSKRKKIDHLIDYLHQQQQMDTLLQKLEQDYPTRYRQYINEIVTAQPTASMQPNPALSLVTNSSSNVPTNTQSKRILIVTVTKVEAQAVLEVFSQAAGEKWTRQPIGNRTYYNLGTHGGVPVSMVQSEMGTATPSGALLTVRQAIHDLQPQAVIMCGIAFGLRPKKQQLGDILVSRQLLYYEAQKVDLQHGQMSRGDRTMAAERLLDRFRSGDNDWQGAPTHFGLIMSGEKLVNEPAFRDWLLNTEPEAIGGEMEGAGLYAAARETKVDWILVKAICDWADSTKNDDAHQLAARNAAQFVLHVLQLGGWDGFDQLP